MSYSKFSGGLVRVAAVVVSVGLAGCGGREPGPTTAASGNASRPAMAPAVAVAAAAPQPPLKDVLDSTSGHVVGISYPKGLSNYPALAALAQRFAEQARAGVLQEEKQHPAKPGDGPFELSLEFQLKHESPQMVVLAVDGSSFTGGAHGNPLIQRWVWLPAAAKLLTTADLFPAPGGLQHVAGLVRAQLIDDLSRRLDADAVAPAERRELLKIATAAIDGGTGPHPANFAVYEPVIDGDGRVTAIRFVFAPQQVGDYAEGLHSVEIPGSRLIADVAPAYRHLFQPSG